jgi:hypothetical protein
VADTRCDLTELLVEQCACKQHRGGQAPDEQATAERLATRARLLGGLNSWFAARFPGSCLTCGGPFEEGDAILSAGFNARKYIADCCPGEDDRG